jgi:hypothetical protein
MAALFRLRVTLWGGPVWGVGELEAKVRQAGFADVRALPAGPGALSATVIGRRAG